MSACASVQGRIPDLPLSHGEFLDVRPLIERMIDYQRVIVFVRGRDADLKRPEWVDAPALHAAGRDGTAPRDGDDPGYFFFRGVSGAVSGDNNIQLAERDAALDASRQIVGFLLRESGLVSISQERWISREGTMYASGFGESLMADASHAAFSGLEPLETYFEIWLLKGPKAESWTRWEIVGYGLYRLSREAAREGIKRAILDRYLDQARTQGLSAADRRRLEQEAEAVAARVARGIEQARPYIQ